MKELLQNLVLDLRNTNAEILLLQFRRSGIETHIGFNHFSPKLYLQDQEQAIDYPNLIELSDLTYMIHSNQSTRHLVGNALESHSDKQEMLSLDSSASYTANQIAHHFKKDKEIVIYKNGWIHNSVIYKL